MSCILNARAVLLYQLRPVLDAVTKFLADFTQSWLQAVLPTNSRFSGDIVCFPMGGCNSDVIYVDSVGFYVLSLQRLAPNTRQNWNKLCGSAGVHISSGGLRVLFCCLKHVRSGMSHSSEGRPLQF